MKICPNGHKLGTEDFPDNFACCPMCAANLVPKIEKLVCSKCGFQLEPDWMCCPACQTAIKETEFREENDKKIEDKKIENSKYIDEDAWMEDDFDEDDCLKAAENGDMGAQYNLYRYYDVNNTNKKKGIELLKLSADLGFAPAQVEYATKSIYGSKGVSKSPANAYNYYKKAADQDYGYGYAGLASCYEKGIYVSKDSKKAITYYEKAIEKECIDVYSDLGELYESLDEDELAFNVYKKGSDLGNLDCKESLGCAHYLGRGTNINKQKAIELWKECCNQESEDIIPSTAAYFLAEEYLSGQNMTVDYREAFRLLNIAVEKNDVYAICKMAECYQNHIGVEKSLSKAIEFYKKGVDLGSSEAMNSLALLYLNERNEASNAFSYFLQAAEVGDLPVAMWNVGFCYENGIGTDVDNELAEFWKNQAIEAGYEPDEEDKTNNDSGSGIGAALATGAGILLGGAIGLAAGLFGSKKK